MGLLLYSSLPWFFLTDLWLPTLLESTSVQCIRGREDRTCLCALLCVHVEKVSIANAKLFLEEEINLPYKYFVFPSFPPNFTTPLYVA